MNGLRFSFTASLIPVLLLIIHRRRHTFATLMLTQGVSVESVSKMLGHTDIKTTQIYARILNEKVITEVSGIAAKYDSLAESWEE